VIAPAAAKRVKLVVLDVDGVLTDAGYYLGDVEGAPAEFLRYDIQDGVGLMLLRQAGIKLAVITGRESESVRLRAAQLSIDALVQDRKGRKVPALRKMIEQLGVTMEEVAFLGDDIPDIGVLRLVGMPVAVGNAAKDVLAVAQVHLTKHGGHGAIREFCELLLGARGEWDAQVAEYVSSRITEVTS
jgi:3-deoxy-D-manno-octulosonate 8-phosphate phosphatase (KDO 8-P phosphatase)